MKRLKWISILAFLLGSSIYASPETDSLELTATFCHFSDTGLRCSCPDEAKEQRNEEQKIDKKVRKENR